MKLLKINKRFFSQKKLYDKVDLFKQKEEELYTNKEINKKILDAQLEDPQTLQIFDSFKNSKNNEYLKMIEFMDEHKEREQNQKNQIEKLSEDQIQQAFQDFKKEQEDLIKIQKSGYSNSFFKPVSDQKVSVNLLKPPRNSKEALKTLQEADSRYIKNKNFLYGREAVNQEFNQNKEIQEGKLLQNVPKGISFSRLIYPQNQSELIICGVKRRALLHSSYINDLIFELQPECTFLQVPPDIPMFIKPQGESENDYRGEWYQFIRKSKNSNFYVNPLPKYLRDIVMTKEKIDNLLNCTIQQNPNEFQVAPQLIYSAEDRLEHLQSADDPLAPDSFLTPLLYSHNSLMSNDLNPRLMVMGDMPILVQKELQARAMTIKECQALFSQTLQQWSIQGNLNFSPELKYKEIFVLPRVKYMTEVLRQLALSYKQIIAVVDQDLIPFIEDNWQQLPKRQQNLNDFLQIPKQYNGNNDPLQQDTFLEFVEKLSILDLIITSQPPNFLHNNFLKLESFPYSHKGFLGHETAVLNVFTFWKHYRQKYTKEMGSKILMDEEFDKWQKDQGYQHEESNN